MLALAACVTEPLPREVPERVAVRSDALLATNLVGTSLPARTLALTFDDGPGDRTGAMSTYLAAQGIRATFFFNGARIAPTALPNPNGTPVTPNATALLAKVVADGHLVANHTTTHRDLVGVVLPTGAENVVQEIAETDADIAPFVPPGRLLFRAPFGYYDANVWNAVKASAMNKYVGPVRWDIGGASGNYPAQAADWACWQNALQAGGGASFGVGTEACGDAYLTEIGAVGRGIVLMHDSSASANGNTLAMVEYIVPILKSRGYAFVRADEVPAIAALLGSPPCHPSCLTCSGGGANQCASCAAGSWLGAGRCRSCSACAPGSYATAACAAAADTACAPCAAGTFSAASGAAA
jgi:peptidoglycan/xylan/chitin deacetylase (PgdA/CDA1 family)